MIRIQLLSTLAGICLTAGAFATATSPPQASAAATGVPDSLTAMVAAVDGKARRLEVITGVGHALRVIQVGVDPMCQIEVAGAPARLEDLKRGKIVRMRYRKVREQSVADMIETLEPEPTR